MAAVFTKTGEASLLGGIKMITGTLAMDNSYPTGGEAVDLSAYFPGGSVLFGFGFNPGAAAGYVFVHNAGTAAAGKIMAFEGDFDPAAVAPLIECINTRDLSGVTACPMVFLGN